MASRILLISTNRCASPDPVFPLGLAYLSAALRQAGHETRWADALVESQTLPEILADFKPQIVGVSLRNIDDVVIRNRAIYYDALLSTCQAVRARTSCPIILGGSGFSIFPRQLLEMSGADYGVWGEGETSFLALLSALNNGGQIEAIPGLVYRQGSQVMVNPQRQDELPRLDHPPDYPPELAEYYLLHSGMLNLQTQRGCAFNCCYCTYPLIEGRRHRRRPPEAIADEMAHMEKLGARHAFMVDSVFNSSPTHVEETCEALVRRGLKIRWSCFLRPQGLTAELMKLMARAGLTHVEFGSDSFCDDVLQAYHKGFTFEDIESSSGLAQRENLDYCHFLISGGLGETPATLEAGFQNSLRLKNAVIMALVGTRIYPGTALFTQAVREGVIHPDADLLAPAYYVAPGLTSEGVFEKLREFARRSPSWIAGDPTPGYNRLVERLRQRGVVGPLWSYFSMLQRLRPAVSPA